MGQGGSRGRHQAGVRPKAYATDIPWFPILLKAGDPVFRCDSDRTEKPRRTGYPACAGYDGAPHISRALLKANDDTRRVFSSRIKVRVIGGSARWLQFSRSQSRQLTPIGVPSALSRSIPVA